VTPPLLKGGQGRSADSVRDDGITLFWLAVAFLVVAVVLLCEVGR